MEFRSWGLGSRVPSSVQQAQRCGRGRRDQPCPCKHVAGSRSARCKKHAYGALPICMCIDTYTYTHTHTSYTCIHAHAQTHIHARTFTRTYTYILVYADTYVHACAHTHTHACMHACIHTYIYYAHASMLLVGMPCCVTYSMHARSPMSQLLVRACLPVHLSLVGFKCLFYVCVQYDRKRKQLIMRHARQQMVPQAHMIIQPVCHGVTLQCHEIFRGTLRKSRCNWPRKTGNVG